MSNNPKSFFYNNPSSEIGYVMLFAIVLLAIFMAASASLLGYTTLNVRGTRIAYEQDKAVYLAEAGIDKAIYKLNLDGSYTGETDGSLAGGEFITVVTSEGPSKKIITSTGYVPTAANPKTQKTIQAKATIDTSGVAFNYGVQVGAGGLVMDNNSKINGNVFSNGNVTGGKGTTTGDVIVAAGTSLTPDAEWTVQNQDFNFGNISSRRDAAQSFKPSSTNPLNKVEVYIKKVGSPGDLTVRIVPDNNGNPDDAALAVSNISASLVTGSYGWIEAVFSSPPTVSQGVSYWLMLSAPAINSSKYYVWGTDSNNGYGNGVGKFSDDWDDNSPAWVLANGDFNYKIFMGGVITYVDSKIKFGGNLTATEIRDCGEVDLTAYYNTVFTSCSAGSTVGGTVAPGPEAMPVSSAQIDDWETTASGGDTLPGPYTIDGSETLGPVKIDGDLIINGGAVLNLTGPIWVKGDITFYNNAKLTIDPSLGNTGTVLLADDSSNPGTKGIVTISNNTIIEGNGNPNSYPMILTTNSSLTGAMYVNNNSAGAIYYASNGSIEVSNNAGGNQITGYKIHMGENSVINYQTGLQNANFSNGPGGAWEFEPGSYYIEP